MNILALKVDGLEPALVAWRLSRDKNKAADFREVVRIDAPVTEMPSAFCHFVGFTILEREILASSRTHVMWARTSYVDDPLTYRLPEDLWEKTDKMRHRHIKVNMRSAKDRGDSQDDWRRLLPISSETAFSMRLSFRDAAKYAKYFSYLSRSCDEKLKARMVRASSCFTSLMAEFLPGGVAEAHELASSIVEDVTMSKFLNEDELLEPGECWKSDFGQITTAALEVPLWLRAHFVRHRPITIVDDLFQLLRRPDVLELPISHPMRIEVAASRDVWVALLGKRSCWIAGTTLAREKDPWQEIADEFGDQVLPCASGTCPYVGDAMARVEGTFDKGAPCPRFIRLYGLDPGPHLARIEAALASRGSRWKNEIDMMMKANV